MNRNPCIVGWYHSPFGKLEDDLEAMIVKAALGAVSDAGLEPHEIDAIYVGHFNSGMSAQRFPGSLVLQAHEGFRFKPAVRMENACASGSAAIHAGLDFLNAGRGRHVLVVGVEKMTNLPGPHIADSLLGACYRKEEGHIEAGFVGVFAEIAKTYFAKYGDQSTALAHIAAKNHRNGMHNPYAQMRKELDLAFCNTVSEKNPLVAAPLRRTDCSPVSDGAAAVVLATHDAARAARRRVAFRATAHVNDYFPMSRRDMTELTGAGRAFRQALEAARLDLFDLDLVETHDCFTIAELMEYEAMGLTAPGEGARAVLEGWVERDGKLPVNVSGGLKAKGHPIGATGVSMHALVAMQLCGEAPQGMQLPRAERGAIFNMGGAAVANHVSILERA